MRLSASLFAVAFLSVVATAADPPGISVAATSPQTSQPLGVVKCEPGRFVPLTIVPGKPALLLGNEAGLVEVYPVKPGEAVFGVRFDEPAGAKTKRYTFPDGVTHLAVAGDVSGPVNLVAVVNGKVPTDPPVVAGKMAIEVVGSRPPPGPVDPVDPPAVKGKLHGWVLLEETSQAWAGRGKAVADAITWSDANAVKHRVFDISGPVPADIQPYMDRAKGKPWPQLFLVTAKGELLYGGDCPKTAAGLPDLLKKYKGE